MSIIDELIEFPTEASVIAKFEGAVRLGRLSEKQIAFGKAIIANPAIVAAETAKRQDAAYAAIRATVNPNAAAEAAQREAAANRGVAEGQRVAITSKKQGRREGVVLWIEGEKVAVRIDGVTMAVITTTDKIEVIA